MSSWASTLGATANPLEVAAKLATYLPDSVDGQPMAAGDLKTIAPATHAATAKTVPVDADELPLADSAASNALKKLTVADLKTLIADVASPVCVTIPATSTPSVVSSNFASATSNGYPFNAYRITSGTGLNEYVEFIVALRKGTYSFRLHHYVGTSHGIYTVAVDGSSIGTIDSYNATPSAWTTSTLSNVAIATSGTHTVRLSMLTKNASSSAYTALWFALLINQTA